MGDVTRKVMFPGISAASLVIAACSSDYAPSADSGRAEVAPTTADRQAAALLSLSNNSTLELKKDPYERAVACLVALDSVQERFVEVGALDEKMKRTMRGARALYERKASALNGHSAVDLARDVEAGRATSDDPSLQARTATSCLRALT